MPDYEYEYVIWDWNGTLLDDMWLALEVANGMLRRRNLPEMDAHRYREIFDFPVEHYYRRAGFDFTKEPFSVLADEFIGEFNSRIRECPLHRGAEQTVRALRERGVSQIVLSASRETTLREAVTHYRLHHLFDSLHGLHNHMAVSKAQVGIDLIARHGIPPEKAVVVGDTVHDAEVAGEMGVDCVLIAAGHHSRARLESTGVPVHDTLEESVVSAPGVFGHGNNRRGGN
jgi:phosphoglycolate phosphatase